MDRFLSAVVVKPYGAEATELTVKMQAKRDRRLWFVLWEVSEWAGELPVLLGYTFQPDLSES